jgi:hypothetical protein
MKDVAAEASPHGLFSFRGSGHDKSWRALRRLAHSSERSRTYVKINMEERYAGSTNDSQFLTLLAAAVVQPIFDFA